MKAVIATSLLLSAGFASAQFVPPAMLPQSGPTSMGGFNVGLTFSVLQMGTNSLMTGQGAWVFAESNMYQTYWQRLTGQPGITAPGGIDWFHEKVVLVTLGQRNTGGYSVFVSSVESGPNGVTIIRATERQPYPGVPTAQVQSAPWALIKVPRTVHQVALSVMPSMVPPDILLTPGYPPYGGGYGGYGDVLYENYFNGPNCLDTNQGWYVINSESQYTQYWQNSISNEVPACDVNWKRFSLIAFHLGSRPSKGYELSVKSVQKQANGRVLVLLQEKRPQRNEVVQSDPTSPYVIIRVEKPVGKFDIQLVKG